MVAAPASRASGEPPAGTSANVWWAIGLGGAAMAAAPTSRAASELLLRKRNLLFHGDAALAWAGAAAAVRGRHTPRAAPEARRAPGAACAGARSEVGAAHAYLTACANARPPPRT